MTANRTWPIIKYSDLHAVFHHTPCTSEFKQLHEKKDMTTSVMIVVSQRLSSLMTVVTHPDDFQHESILGAFADSQKQFHSMLC